jgi:hypothetical protein
MFRSLFTVALLAALAVAARADDRPSEDELFGTKPAAPPAAAAQPPASAGEAGQPPAAAPPGKSRLNEAEAELFGSKGSPNSQPPPPEGVISREREDWLKVGGQLYLRVQGSASEDTRPHDWPLASPNLLDVYLDSRPNDRVRAFVLGRMSYDPTLPSGSKTALSGSGSDAGGSGLSGLAGTTSANPGGVLDQLWVNFDVGHRAFVTAGRQHVKWGVGKFWNPTDYLHPVKRNPLAVFDTRTGTTMVKVHVPWEKEGWNFYGIALLEDAAGDTTRTSNRLGRVGAGGRAEIVLGPAELGLDALAQDGHHPRYGLDVSTGLGPFDLYGEAALRDGVDGSHWRRTAATANPLVPAELDGWERHDPRGLTPQLVAGATFAANYSDEDAVTVGAEYFFNDAGYSSRAVYSYLLLGAPAVVNGQLVAQDPTAFQPFYLGRHYAGLYAYLPKPGRWNDTNFTLSVLGNLSDHSFVARLDHSVLVLTYLSVETYLAGHLGPTGGEFRFALPASVTALAAQQAGGVVLPSGAPVVDVGLALRVKL